jgi:hypothetical protein
MLRVRKQKGFYDNSPTEATILNGHLHFQACIYIVIMDELQSFLQQRKSTYAQLSLDFTFLYVYF